MSRFTDTIAAPATPTGTSAIAVIRISGPATIGIVRELLGGEPQPRLLRRADYRERTGQVLDEVLCVYFAAPHSYTGEDAAEISTHGNPLIAQRVLQDLCARGCRLACPGEFTERAFLNGRMDLSQAEAVIDLINARSERALAAANQQLRGSLGGYVNIITDRLVGALARIEAYIDFPEEDLPSEDRSVVIGELQEAQKETARLLSTRRYGEMLRDGIKTVIAGAPNVGKSSVLNRLVGHERALVSPEPGTTRDFLEERMMLGPHCIRLIDTAGLNPRPARLEEMGMRKSYERLAEADLVLAVVDVSAPSPALPSDLIPHLRPESTIIVANKVDLTDEAFALDVDFNSFTSVKCSALTGIGFDKLEQAMIDLADRSRVDWGDETIAINARHADALEAARQGLASALKLAADRGPVELVACDVRSVLGALGEIGGKIDNEHVLDELFKTFCIGK